MALIATFNANVKVGRLGTAAAGQLSVFDDGMVVTDGRIDSIAARALASPGGRE